MKSKKTNYRRIFFLIAIVLCGIKINTNSQNLGNELIIIESNCNHSGLFCTGCGFQDAIVGTFPVHRTLEFRTFFNKSCDYDLSNVINCDQTAWNKLMKISETFAPREYSIRLGWAWNLVSEKMDLGFYAHFSGQDNEEFLSLDNPWDLEAWLDGELIFAHNGMAVTVGSHIVGWKGVAMRRKIYDRDRFVVTGVNSCAYFGGLCPAPHFMSMKVHHIFAYSERSDPLWRDAAYKGFSRSEFYDGEDKTVYASNTITASLEAFTADDPDNPNDPEFLERYTIIHDGANVTFVAGNQIKLLPGFHAEAGSNFHAYIGSAPQDYIFQPPGTPPNHTYDIFDDGEIDSLVVLNDTLGNNSNSTAGQEEEEIKPSFENKLTEPFPNPFTESAVIQYSLKDASSVSLNVYNIFGQQVATLVSHPNQEAGVYQVTFHAGNLPSGIYFYTLRADNFMETKKMVLMK